MTVPLLLRPRAPFPNINIQTLEAGAVLHRIHGSDFRATEFNPCKGQPTRFAPFNDSNGNCIPTFYAATNREAAAFASIFRDIEPNAPFKTVRLDVVEAHSVSKIASMRDLTVARLFAPDLKAWGLNRTDLIETPKSTYDQTVLWAQVIHQARANIDGLIWASRQCDREQCAILFGDRVAEHVLQELERIDVSTDADLLLELRKFGLRAGITIIS